MKAIIVILLIVLSMGVLVGQQDAVFSAGDLAFAVALLPMLLGKIKPPVETSILTGGVITIFGFAFVSLNLYWSAFGCFVCGAGWLLLAVQTVDWVAVINRFKHND